jgi:hypothetical protein
MIYFQKSHFSLIFIDTGIQMLEIRSEVSKRLCLRFSANNFGETKYQTVMRATAKCKVIQVSKHHTMLAGEVGWGGGEDTNSYK